LVRPRGANQIRGAGFESPAVTPDPNPTLTASFYLNRDPAGRSPDEMQQMHRDAEEPHPKSCQILHEEPSRAVGEDGAEIRS